MRRTKYIKEKIEHGSFKIKIHKINIDSETKGGWVKQSISIQCLLDRSLNRWFTHWKKKKSKTHNSSLRFTQWSKLEGEQYQKNRDECITNSGIEKANLMYPIFETFEHKSVWDFLVYIEYDHKNKKVSNTDTLILINEKPK